SKQVNQFGSFSFDGQSSNSQVAALFTSNYNQGDDHHIYYGNDNNNDYNNDDDDDESIIRWKQLKAKIQMKLLQRSTVKEMCSRGILFDHPNISPQLIARALKRARDKAKHILRAFLTTRPNVRELQNKNILIHVETHAKHKRELSADLQHKIRMRPSLQDTPQANGGVSLLHFNGKFIPLIQSLPLQTRSHQDQLQTPSNGHAQEQVQDGDTEGTNEDLKEEIRRLQQIIADTSMIKNYLENENNALRDSLRNTQLHKDQEYKMRLQRYSVVEEHSLEEITQEIEQENVQDFNKQFVNEVTVFYQKLIDCLHNSSQLPWPDALRLSFTNQIQLLQEHMSSSLLGNLANSPNKNIFIFFAESLRNILSQIQFHLLDCNKQKDQILRDLEIARKKIKKSMYQLSMTQLQLEEEEEAIEPSQISQLKEEVERAQQDKIVLLQSAQIEIDRMRSQIRYLSELIQKKIHLLQFHKIRHTLEVLSNMSGQNNCISVLLFLCFVSNPSPFFLLLKMGLTSVSFFFLSKIPIFLIKLYRV
ncbi:hypothetical protein RFI_25719, partial [Reticulomyxa filosa]